MENLRQRAQILLERVDIEDRQKRMHEIEAESTAPDFWQDTNKATVKMKELAALQKEIDDAEKIKSLLSQENEEELSELLEELELALYLSGEYDKGNAILSIHAGQGGVDAMDWAEMLYRMYSRYNEQRGWKAEILDITQGEEAGIKSVTVLVEGEFAYGYLKNEQGVHRLVRLSPFNADHLRQTSFALVEVLPQVEEIKGVVIKDDDLEWDFYRASSHGGQNVQKVSSAVRLKHIPTGIVVTAQTERYQGQNREYALKLLKAKLWVLEQEKRKQEQAEIKGGYVAPSWGNQIRNYVLHPYQLVKDTRTGEETGNVEKVLDGQIDQFIEAELKRDKSAL
jgi:peptide chain release factor 2